MDRRGDRTHAQSLWRIALLALTLMWIGVSAAAAATATCLGDCEGGWQTPGSCGVAEEYCEGNEVVECDVLICWDDERGDYNCGGIITSKHDCNGCEEEPY